MDLETTVSQKFDGFMAACFPSGGTTEDQRREMRRAFYGGFMAGLCTDNSRVGPLMVELERFKADVLAGRA